MCKLIHDGPLTIKLYDDGCDRVLNADESTECERERLRLEREEASAPKRTGAKANRADRGKAG